MIRFLAWRMHRRGLVGFAAGGFLVSFLYGAAFEQAAGNTAASQAAFGRSVSLVSKQFAFLIPVPVHPETLGGYEQYKWLAAAIVMMMIWAAVAGVGAGRGDEERGLTEQWIASGLSRRRLAIARSAAFGLVLLISSVASVLGIVLVAPIVHQDPNVAGELGKAVSMAAGLFCGYAIALFLSQVPSDRQTATALGVGAILLLLVVNGVADTTDAAAWIGPASPFHWLERTSSAAPGGTFDAAGTLGLAVAGAVLVAAALAIFERRDIGRGLLGRRAGGAAVRAASRNPMLRAVFTEGLWEQRFGLLAWALGTMVLGGLMVSVTRSVADAIFADQRLAAVFTHAAPGPPYAALLSFMWFAFALLLLAGYAVVQVSRWAAQDQQGRVEMLLSVPVSRTRVIIARALEFAAASLVIVAAGYAGVAAALPASGIGLDAGRMFAASALMWPFALAFGGLGVAVAGRWPRIAVPFLAAFAAVEYLLGDLAPIFQAPGWLANLSVFHLYGNPAVTGLTWTPAVSMALVFVAGFAAAVLLVKRRDLSSA